MSQQMMQFGYSCLGHIKNQLQQDSAANAQGMTFSMEPVYGKAGEGARIGITTHTEPCAHHHDVIGYCLKIGFATVEARAAASRGIADVHSTIKGLFGLQNDAAWVLRDKNTNDVWFTFATRDKNPLAFFDQTLEKTTMDGIFKQGRVHQ